MTAPVILHRGDCLEVMAALPESTFDAVVTDPPYHLTSIVRRFGAGDAAPAVHGTDGLFARSSRGFMGKEWDGGDIAFRSETWAAVLRVLKPGGHLLAFNHSRTWHHMAVAIEAAGFEARDCLAWLYGTGFPKSHDIAAGLEKLGSAEAAQWEGWGTALKPGFEPIFLARKPLAETSIARQHLATGTGGLNIDAARIPGAKPATVRGANTAGAVKFSGLGPQGRIEDDGKGRWPANVLHDGSREVLDRFPVDAEGSVARFFYSAKADAADRDGSEHPTVKPQSLMRWLVRLATARGGLILDPFGGSGSTAWAAAREGRRCVLIEREPEYQAHIAAKIDRLADPSKAAPAAPEATAQQSLF